MRSADTKRLLLLSALWLCLAFAPVHYAIAGPYSDDLAKCLVRSTTSADKTVLIQWIFATVTLHPQVNWMSSVSNAQRAELNEKTARLLQRLLTESCLSETQQALKREGESTIEAGFNVLGQVAMRELFGDANVAEGLAEVGKHLDREKIQKVLGPPSQ